MNNFRHANVALCLAATRLGDVREIAGARSNPMIVAWIKAALPSFTGSDATAWSSAFMLAVADAAGADLGDKRPNLLARSWEQVGQPVRISQATQGDVVILIRGRVWQGHVGLLCRMEDTRVVLLGGNQANRSGFKTFPRWRIRAIRRLYHLDRGVVGDA